jgi:hypothetical protein
LVEGRLGADLLVVDFLGTDFMLLSFFDCGRNPRPTLG